MKDLLNQHCELVTYDGFLLDHLLWKFWNRDYAKIVDLMEKVTLQIGASRNWFDENGEPLYIWRNLSDALRFYGVTDADVNLNDPMGVIQKTMLLHQMMLAAEGVTQSEA